MHNHSIVLTCHGMTVGPLPLMYYIQGARREKDPQVGEGTVIHHKGEVKGGGLLQGGAVRNDHQQEGLITDDHHQEELMTDYRHQGGLTRDGHH